MSIDRTPIREFVENNPGCLRRDIIEGINWEYPPSYVTDTLCSLARKGVVFSKVPDNGRKSETRWYPSTPDNIVFGEE